MRRKKEPPRHWRDRFPVPIKNLPLPANPPVFAFFPLRISLNHMKNKPNEAGNEPSASSKEKENGGEVTTLPRLEMYAVLGLELGKRIFEKLEKVEDSVAILAAQKARELHPDESKTEKDR